MRLLFISWHFYLDSTNGASISSRELLLELARRGWKVATLCGPAVDSRDGATVESILEKRGVKLRRRVSNDDSPEFAAISFRDESIDSVAFCPKDGSQIPTRSVGVAFLQTIDAFLARFKPDVVVTYGGYWLGGELLATCRRRGAKTVVMLQNFAYRDRNYFRDVDLVIVPSQYSADVYRDRLGLETFVAPPLIDRKRVAPDADDEANDADEPERQRRLLFVNPSYNKGVCLFARIAKELAITRPDVPILVVEGSDGVQTMRSLPFDWTGVRNISTMANVARPSVFYRLAKVALVPSFFDESFGRAAAEALMAGVPVVASTRGALPETLGNAAILLDIPAQYDPTTRTIPTAEDARPWLDAILRLWDDREFYAEMQSKGRARAQIWEYSRVADAYERAFRALVDKSTR